MIEKNRFSVFRWEYPFWGFPEPEKWFCEVKMVCLCEGSFSVSTTEPILTEFTPNMHLVQHIGTRRFYEKVLKSNPILVNPSPR